jgi:hypothetical protein
VAMTWNFKLELPALSTSTFTSFSTDDVLTRVRYTNAGLRHELPQAHDEYYGK